MLDAVLGVLDGLGALSDPLAWLVVGLFVAGAVLDRYDREYARLLLVATWGLFALFWLTVVHHFAIDQKSVVEGVGTAAAVPLSLYVGYLLAKGRESLFVLSRAVAVMGVFYMPFVAIPAVRQAAIESITDQTDFVIGLLGYDPQVVTGVADAGGVRLSEGGPYIASKTYPYESTFLYYQGETPVTLTIKIACTGIGSMAIIAGLVAAVDAPWRRKLGVLALVLPVIHVLNIARNTFISISLGEQLFQVFPEVVMGLFSLQDAEMVSYIVADRIISQGLSVVVLVALVVLIVRRLPEVLTVVEDGLFLVTGRDYELADALGVDRP